MTGQFITLEGIEGVGKSTNAAYVQEILERAGLKVLLTREPGGTALAEELRNLLLVPREEAVSQITELLLMFAARAQHLQHKILPTLQAGTWVVCDRFTDATFAYQGGGRGIDNSLIQSLESIVQNGLQPNLTILLDIDVKTGLTRARQRSAPDRFESEQQQFFEKVRQAYLNRASQNPQRFAVVDAGQTLPQVQVSIAALLQAKLGVQCESSC